MRNYMCYYLRPFDLHIFEESMRNYVCNHLRLFDIHGNPSLYLMNEVVLGGGGLVPDGAGVPGGEPAQFDRLRVAVAQVIKVS